MKKFRVSCTWKMSGEFFVEADTLKEAIDTVDAGDDLFSGLPKNAVYVDDSFEIDEEYTREMNSHLSDKED